MVDADCSYQQVLVVRQGRQQCSESACTKALLAGAECLQLFLNHALCSAEHALPQMTHKYFVFYKAASEISLTVLLITVDVPHRMQAVAGPLFTRNMGMSLPA